MSDRTMSPGGQDRPPVTCPRDARPQADGGPTPPTRRSRHGLPARRAFGAGPRLAATVLALLLSGCSAPLAVP
ncbi:MAG: hypothetical protein LBR32_06710, partial [Propionibacteriaceae bacterium]|nr:hypothetical protein [Propionibacteriaceae bacterium]